MTSSPPRPWRSSSSESPAAWSCPRIALGPHGEGPGREDGTGGAAHRVPAADFSKHNGNLTCGRGCDRHSGTVAHPPPLAGREVRQQDSRTKQVVFFPHSPERLGDAWPRRLLCLVDRQIPVHFSVFGVPVCPRFGAAEVALIRRFGRQVLTPASWGKHGSQENSLGELKHCATLGAVESADILIVSLSLQASGGRPAGLVPTPTQQLSFERSIFRVFEMPYISPNSSSRVSE